MKQKKEILLNQGWLGSRNFTIFLAIILFLGLVSLIRQTLQYFSVQKNINQINVEITKLEAKNSDLNQKLQYINSEFYKEKEARLKLGLLKPGEKMIAVAPATLNGQAEAAVGKTVIDKRLNIVKWWQYFFGK